MAFSYSIVHLKSIGQERHQVVKYALATFGWNGFKLVQVGMIQF